MRDDLVDGAPSGVLDGDPDEALRLICERFGLRFYIVCPVIEAETFSSRSVMATNIPSDALALFDEARWWSKFQPILRSMERGRPVAFALKAAVADPIHEHGERFDAILASHDVHEAISFPVHCGPILGFCAFSARAISLEADDTDWLQIRALGIFDTLCRERKRERPFLTPRELECLSWTSLGKTSGEIAVILAISEHTVVRHLTSVTSKLKAQNRSHAVAKAIRLSLLD